MERLQTGCQSLTHIGTTRQCSCASPRHGSKSCRRNCTARLQVNRMLRCTSALVSGTGISIRKSFWPSRRYLSLVVCSKAETLMKMRWEMPGRTPDAGRDDWHNALPSQVVHEQIQEAGLHPIRRRDPRQPFPPKCCLARVTTTVA
jgi:hypothetical protein